MKITNEQKQQALTNARKTLARRRNMRDSDTSLGRTLRRNSFAAWGNDKCISNAKSAIEAMENGYASDRQYRYWMSH